MARRIERLQIVLCLVGIAMCGVYFVSRWNGVVGPLIVIAWAAIAVGGYRLIRGNDEAVRR